MLFWRPYNPTQHYITLHYLAHSIYTQYISHKVYTLFRKNKLCRVCRVCRVSDRNLWNCHTGVCQVLLFWRPYNPTQPYITLHYLAHSIYTQYISYTVYTLFRKNKLCRVCRVCRVSDRKLWNCQTGVCEVLLFWRPYNPTQPYTTLHNPTLSCT